MIEAFTVSLSMAGLTPDAQDLIRREFGRRLRAIVADSNGRTLTPGEAVRE